MLGYTQKGKELYAPSGPDMTIADAEKLLARWAVEQLNHGRAIDDKFYRLVSCINDETPDQATREWILKIFWIHRVPPARKSILSTMTATGLLALDQKGLEDLVLKTSAKGTAPDAAGLVALDMAVALHAFPKVMSLYAKPDAGMSSKYTFLASDSDA